MPEDRFAVGNKKNARQRVQDKMDRDAEKRASKGEEFVCANCRLWYPLSSYLYEYKGETMTARRCAACRRSRRSPVRRSALKSKPTRSNIRRA